MTSILAIMTALTLVIFRDAKFNNDYEVAYCFLFVGSHGQEANIVQWKLINCREYSQICCSGIKEGCKLKTACIQLIENVPHPCDVLTELGCTPVGGLGVIEVENKN